MHGIARLATVLALVLSLGLHWAVLQTVAWTGMIVSYSRAASFREAVDKTFDGEHPCCLCKLIRQGREAQKRDGDRQVKPGSKLDPGLVWQALRLDFARAHEAVPGLHVAPLCRRDPPPRPPPRSLA